RGEIAVDRTEVALAVDQHVAQRKRLRHTDDGVVHGRIAVWVIFTDHIADDTRRLLVRLVVIVVQLAHRKQHATVHRLQTIAHIGQRPAYDDAHRIVQIGLLQFVFDVDRKDFFGDFTHGYGYSFLSVQGLTETASACAGHRQPHAMERTMPVAKGRNRTINQRPTDSENPPSPALAGILPGAVNHWIFSLADVCRVRLRRHLRAPSSRGDYFRALDCSGGASQRRAGTPRPSHQRGMHRRDYSGGTGRDHRRHADIPARPARTDAGPRQRPRPRADGAAARLHRGSAVGARAPRPYLAHRK